MKKMKHFSIFYLLSQRLLSNDLPTSPTTKTLAVTSSEEDMNNNTNNNNNNTNNNNNISNSSNNLNNGHQNGDTNEVKKVG